MSRRKEEGGPGPRILDEVPPLSVQDKTHFCADRRTQPESDFITREHTLPEVPLWDRLSSLLRLHSCAPPRRRVHGTLTSLGGYRAFYCQLRDGNVREISVALAARLDSETLATSATKARLAALIAAMANHLRLASPPTVSSRLVSLGVAMIFNWEDRIGKIASAEYYGAFNLPPRCVLMAGRSILSRALIACN